MCLEGEVLTVVQNFANIERNFELAWTLVNNRYENRPLLIFTHVSQLLSLPSVTVAKPNLLRALIDRTSAIVASLRKLDEPVDTWSTLLVVMTVLKLDKTTRREWENKSISHAAFPTFVDLEEFIVQRIQALTLSDFMPPTFDVTPKSPPKTMSSTQSRFAAHVSTAQTLVCAMCAAAHTLPTCSEFKISSPADRVKIVRRSSLCYNCLKSGHFPALCKAKPQCGSCRRKHHALLHDALFKSISIANTAIDPTADTPVTQPPEELVSHLATPLSSIQSVLLATAYVKISTPQGRHLFLRALIDQGSQCSFITETAGQSLRAIRMSCSAVVSGMGERISGYVKQSTRVVVSSLFADKVSISVEALILPRLTPYVPRVSFDNSASTHLQGVQLADSVLHSTCPILLILGADVYDDIILDGLRKSPHGPTAQASIFGWILSGSMRSATILASVSTDITALHLVSNSDLHASLDKFWHIEDVPKASRLSSAEQECEKRFLETTTRDRDGRYCVALPFKTTPPLDLGNSADIAYKAYQCLEWRLSRDVKLEAEYHGFLRTYLSMGHMIPYLAIPGEQCYFIPHHPVIKASSTSTKVRVVFNGSCPTSNGLSLNDHLHVDPKLQEDLPSILLRWHMHRIVCTADVQMMFRQIRLRFEDTSYQLIYWRSEKTGSIEPYRLMTVTYGLLSAPFLSLRVLKQLIADEAHRFSNAAKELGHNVYVDDVLFGADSVEACCELRNAIRQLMSSGKLPLRKWSSNNSDLLRDLPPEDCEVQTLKPFRKDERLHILDLSWAPGIDTFHFSVKDEPPSILTKRQILSCISKLYDPLGQVAPIVIVSKILMLRIWMLQLDWDSEVPSDIANAWRAFLEDLTHLTPLSITRWVHATPNATLELHGFCDASQRAYAAAVYLRVCDGGCTSVHLLTSKTRVAPLARTYVCIPRLELCGAELLSRLLVWTVQSLQLPQLPIHAWSDSAVALYWIAGCPSRWKVFVANRVAAIQNAQHLATWQHVPTNDNPADLASRGLGARELATSSLWWHGPDWLVAPRSEWPHTLPGLDAAHDLEERVVSAHVVVQIDEWSLATRYSDWGKLLRVTSLLFQSMSIAKRSDQPTIGSISPTFVVKARNFWHRYSQQRTLAAELSLIAANTPLPKGNRLASLDPYIDDAHVLRVGGRLDRAAVSATRNMAYTFTITP